MSQKNIIGNEKEIEEKKEEEKTETENETHEPKWEQDEEDDADVVKLKVGESVEGIYTDKTHSGKHSCECYKIKPKDREKAVIILSTTILEKRMQNKEFGELVKIERLEDGKNQAGVTYQRYETYHDKKE